MNASRSHSFSFHILSHHIVILPSSIEMPFVHFAFCHHRSAAQPICVPCAGARVCECEMRPPYPIYLSAFIQTNHRESLSSSPRSYYSSSSRWMKIIWASVVALNGNLCSLRRNAIIETHTHTRAQPETPTKKYVWPKIRSAPQRSGMPTNS